MSVFCLGKKVTLSEIKLIFSLSLGMPEKLIAEFVGLQVKAVRFNLKSLFKKLSVSNGPDLISLLTKDDLDRLDKYYREHNRPRVDDAF